MIRLALVLYSLIGGSLAGAAVIFALVTGRDTLTPILIAAGIGAVAGIPVSLLVARALTGEATGGSEESEG